MAEASPALPPPPSRSLCPPPAVGAAVPGSRTQRLGTGAVGGAGVGRENRCGRRVAPGTEGGGRSQRGFNDAPGAGDAPRSHPRRSPPPAAPPTPPPLKCLPPTGVLSQRSRGPWNVSPFPSWSWKESVS